MFVLSSAWISGTECGNVPHRSSGIPLFPGSGDKHVLTDTLRYLLCWKEQEAGRINLSPEQSVQGEEGPVHSTLFSLGG